MSHDQFKLRRSIYITLSFVFIIWLVKIIEYAFGYDFSEYGILPRTVEGSLGIITAPLIHGDIFHLLSNTFPIVVLGIGIFYFYNRIALNVVALIYLITGFWVWIAARDAYHVGASGIIYGLLTFLLFSGFFRKDGRTLAISFIVLFLYGTTLFTGILPSDGHISWESHLMGALAGIFCAIYFKSTKLDFILKKPVSDEKAEAFTKYTYTYQQNPSPVKEDDSTYTYTYQVNSDSKLD